MDTGFVKLWESTIYNPVWRDDPTAWKIFEYLLVTSYRGNPQGTTVKTLQQITDVCGVKNSANFKAIKRLVKYEMVETKSTNRNTTIKICNWWKYQGKGSPGKNQVNAESKPSNTLIRIKNKEIRNIHTSNFEKTHLRICELFGKNPNQYKLSNARKEKLRLRSKDLGDDGIIKAVTNLSQSKWHMGDNERNWVADPYWCLSSYEKAEEWASKQTESAYIGKLSEMEINL